jgi:chromosomal replication initiator protein
VSNTLDADSLFAQFEKVDTTKQLKSEFAAYPVKDKTADSYWNKCLNIIQDNVSESVFSTWFEPIRAIEYKNDLLTVRVPSQFFCEWIEGHYYSLLQKTVYEVLGEDAKLKYFIDVAQSNSITPQTIKVPAFKYPPAPQPVQAPTLKVGAKIIAEPEPFNSGLNPRYTFENIIAGDSNQLAVSAAQAVAKNPGGTRFNPLFIYGKVGLGKTHIAEAIGNYICLKNPRKRVLYTSSENFSIEFVNALQNNKMSEFKSFYHTLDVLIVDDIQFLASREKTQDNFFHIFNSLHQAGKQLILTSDRAPKDISGIDDRLISRFQWGLTVDIQTPDLEMRMAILNKKSEDEGIELPYDVCEYIARNVTSSVRELEGSLITLLAKHTFDNKDINLALAKEIIEGIAIVEDRPLTIDIIKEKVAAYYNLSVEIMESKTRKHEIALARQMSMYLAKQLTQMSLKAIGGGFGGRDHSTVMHSCQTIENYLVVDKAVKNAHDFLKKQLENR